MMIRLIATLCFSVSLSADAQYYYKDIVTPGQTTERMKKYKSQKIRTVKVLSYESNGEPTPDFSGEQTVSSNFTSIVTRLNTALSGESELTTLFNADGQLIKTIDTTDGAGSITEYTYNSQGMVSTIVNVSTSPGMHQEKEEHFWQYDAGGRPMKMQRIKNGTDTTFISFVADENGNVAEENSRRRGTALQSYYYYYDSEKLLTDVVSYNQKAGRLLPVYVFDYRSDGNIVAMMVVPEGSDDYQKWYYEYNAAALKTKETCLNKRKQLLGKIEYEYN